MIIASSADRAMTVREWDPVLQRSAWGYGPCRAPLPDSHGSVNWRRLLRFLVVEASAQSHPQEALAPFEKETLVVPYRDIYSTVSVVGWALFPVKDGDGQECLSYKQSGLGAMNSCTTS